MKSYLLLILVLLSGLSPAKADKPNGAGYILAIGFPDQRPVPASFRLSVREGKDTAELRLNGVSWVAPITIREVPKLAGNPLEKMFDAVFVSKDGLSSIVITGRFFDFSAGRGDGRIAVHSGAAIAKEAGLPTGPASLSTGTFSMARLDEPAGE